MLVLFSSVQSIFFYLRKKELIKISFLLLKCQPQLLITPWKASCFLAQLLLNFKQSYNPSDLSRSKIYKKYHSLCKSTLIILTSPFILFWGPCDILIQEPPSGINTYNLNSFLEQVEEQKSFCPCFCWLPEYRHLVYFHNLFNYTI